MELRGWVEFDGIVLSNEEISSILIEEPDKISLFGGEFFLKWKSCSARDHYGIILGDCPAGEVWCNGRKIRAIEPKSRSLDLHAAIVDSIRMRSEEGVTALSGGVDSALVAALAQKPCISVGVEGSHDLKRAGKVAGELNLPLEIRTVTSCEIEETIPKVMKIIKDPTPVDLAIATTLFFVAETAHDEGYERILTGQGADEVFGGYSRYLGKNEEQLTSTFSADFSSLSRQGIRDQAVAGYHGTWLSMPYLDIRVVCAASTIPVTEKVSEGVRKRPLREIAARYLSSETAYYEKKAMQYGTGIWKEIKRLARQNGYQNSVSDYMHHIRKA
ncbi:asparagine synthase C-terminal domain-containing protein [Methanospirillum sp.]|uniref:asparagine synthase C-terminal domain-containing protein n=1 Tax=Methanospirillum sp. TaxID=45200 RepID=UPI002D8110E1|nr:asparagine synthase C-terminal domain-containing protein [Methanospirillum sp.]